MGGNRNDRGPAGHRRGMDEREHPTTEQPLNAEPRKKLPSLLALLAVLVTIALVFAVITFLQQRT